MLFMPIKGTFHIVGKSPDGDTIAFKAKKRKHWQKLKKFAKAKKKVKIKGDNTTNLRLQAIDALETHYKGTHQPLALANKATDALLQDAGIRKIVWKSTKNGKRKKVSTADDGQEGYILSRAIGGYGRPVCFVFSGTTSKRNGSKYKLDVSWLKKSINYKLLKKGLCYPSYYEEMSSLVDLRNELTRVAKECAKANKGVWKHDKSRKITVKNKAQLMHKDVIIPKLFRRLVKHLRANKDEVTCFHNCLKNENEKIWLLPDGPEKGFHDVITQKGSTIKMTVRPWDILFKP